MTPARAIVFDAPRTLSVRTLELRHVEAADLEVEVGASGISMGTVLRAGASADIRVGGTVPSDWQA